MKASEIQQLADDYIREVVEARGNDETEAVDRLQSLIYYDAESAWEVALRVLQLTDGENTASIVGASVLEELLGSYPEQFIPRAVELARGDVRMQRAMNYVDIRFDEIPREYCEQLNDLQEKIRTARKRSPR